MSKRLARAGTDLFQPIFTDLRSAIRNELPTAFFCCLATDVILSTSHILHAVHKLEKKGCSMNCSQQLSDVTTNLCRFYKILDQMIEGITNAELTDSLSHNFIVQMIPHHRAAIEMSENLLQYTTFVPLQRIAQNIVNEQTKSIENMQSVLPHCAQLSNSEKDLCLYDRRFRQITQTMFSQMRNACSNNNINANFMREMIPHHQG
ncbi:MAG: DUF305 domain-containing protein, partial [Hydrogeniiclostridium mannosilyticum]